MKVRPVHVWLGLGLLSSIACFGGSSSSEFQANPQVRLAYLGSQAGVAALYRVDGVGETELATAPNVSTPSEFITAGVIQDYASSFTFRVKVNNQVVETRTFTLTAGSKNTIGSAKQGEGAGRIQNFPVSQIAVPSGKWNFSVGHMATGYQGAVDVYVIRNEETIQTAGRAFASVGQFSGTTYRLGDTPGNQIAFCAAGTRQPLLTIAYPTASAVPSKRFTVFLRGTGPTQGGFSSLIVAD